METALAAVHWLAVSIYGGSLFAFAVLLAMRQRLSPLSSEDVVRAWRAWGPGLGLSMGTLILTGVLMHYLRVGGFTWPTDTPAQQLRAGADALFLLLWFSSFHLEIWTLDPCRKLDKDGEITDRAAYEATASKVTRQAWFNVLIFVAVGAMSVAAGAM
ncbi:MAG: hypothetical protein H6741_04200 [Alphaproteobacteria bacterium]|nr:hypothetical protein [Alphaproteobacteria bacterium]